MEALSPGSLFPGSEIAPTLFAGPKPIDAIVPAGVFASDAPGMVAGVSRINFRLPAQVDSSPYNVGFLLQIGEAFSDRFGI